MSCDRDTTKKNIANMFTAVGLIYTKLGSVVDSEIITDGHDVHAYYTLADRRHVIHVQGYPGLSHESAAKVYARLMDLNALEEIRQSKRVSTGNEHEAVVKHFSNFGLGIYIDYDPEILKNKIEQNLPELGYKMPKKV